eukprot:3479831-Rhodomonas_salina.4
MKRGKSREECCEGCSECGKKLREGKVGCERAKEKGGKLLLCRLVLPRYLVPVVLFGGRPETDLGFRVLVIGSLSRARVQGLRSRGQGLGSTVSGLGSLVTNLGSRVWALDTRH